jgi:hypothetical protein
VVRRGRRRELGVEGARIEDSPKLLRWIRAGSSTLQHPDRQPNALIGVNGVLRHAFYFSTNASTTEVGRILTGFTTVTVILLPCATDAPEGGYAIWIPWANAETASEAKVRNDASFIARSDKDGRCNGYGSKCK